VFPCSSFFIFFAGDPPGDVDAPFATWSEDDCCAWSVDCGDFEPDGAREMFIYYAFFLYLIKNYQLRNKIY